MKRLPFEELATTKKGNLGERICIEHFHSKGLVVMTSITDSAHAFDIMVWQGKEKPCIVDIKTKASRTHYPDTGFDTADLDHYLKISEKHNMPVAIFFVDEHRKEVYWGELGDLLQEREVTEGNRTLKYPRSEWNITYFPLEAMNKLCDLDDVQVKELKNHTNRNYSYPTLKSA
ncbi:hypothetical protein [Costertonia aggregata]|uniref:DUF4365 domain-containing protein n=1 Tax=Costertonia aggregata TaxID=343403 RepID=A0A7H9ARJ2_9FLAO|nr:hypothetical protein [Costertonia aggregata]QLG46039.1 hypothetical protein HYG79_12020 [Costertonia aggregata]